LSIVVLAPAGLAIAEPGDIVLASTSDTGVKNNGFALGASPSPDGTVVAFSSEATNLDPADTDTIGDVYTKDLASGDLTLVSTTTEGEKGNGYSWLPSLSADGTAVAFASAATNLHPDDGDSIVDTYVKDLITGELVLVSTAENGVKANAASYFPSISADGTAVAFYSAATNLGQVGGSPGYHVFVKDLVTGDVTLAATNDNGKRANGFSYEATLSADGTRVAFYSEATNLDPADTDTAGDIYVKDLVTGEVMLASVSETGEKSNGWNEYPAISADGTKVVFVSAATNLDPLDTDEVVDVYLKDLVTGDITVVTVSETGEKSDQFAAEPHLSRDGTKVTFTTTATNLHPGDTDGILDVYVKDLVTGELLLASTSDAGVKGNDHNSQPRLSSDGTIVAFESHATNLDPGDTDTTRDIYVKDTDLPHRCRGLDATIIGTVGTEALAGTADDDVILGLGGDDTIDGLAGDDVICGGLGKDTVSGGSGDDFLQGDPGNDSLAGNAGVDSLLGGAGRDQLQGHAGPDELFGGISSDTLLGGSDGDSVYGDAGGDVVYGGEGGDVVHGGDGGDILVGGNDDDTVNGDNGDDTLAGGAGNDTLRGQGDDDGLSGGYGIDSCNGGTGTDRASNGCETKTGIP
jgi:Tol biopolymer transport system component